MKLNIYKRLVLALFAVCLITTVFAISASAVSVMRPSYNRSAAMAEDTADENGVVGGDTSAPGTGEFADDTSNTVSDTSDTTADTAKKETDNMIGDAANRVENAVSDVVDGAGNAVEDVTGGMSIWAIVLIIGIVAAIVTLVLIFFTRRK